MRSHIIRPLVAAFVIAASAVALGACGSSEKDEKVSGKVSPTTAKYLAGYTDGKVAKATGKPVKIGFINQAGALGFPEFTAQTEAAVKLVNNQLGGIGGRPIQLVPCFVNGAEEEGQKCGQKFVNDKGITAIVQSALVQGAASFHSVVDPSGIPIISSFPLANEDAAAPNGYYLTAGSFGTVSSYIQYVKEYLKAKKVSVISLAGDPVSSFVTKQIVFGFETAGFETTSAQVAPNQTDVSGPLDAAGARDADVLIPFVIAPPQCLGMAKSLQNAGADDIPVISLAACAAPSLEQELGDYPKWTYAYGSVSPLAPPHDATEKSDVDAYNDWYKNMVTGEGKDLDGSVSLQPLLTAVKFINEAGGPEATSDEINKTAKGFTDQLYLGPPKTEFGRFEGYPALATLAMRYYPYEGDGKWTDGTDGTWVTGPQVGDLLVEGE